MAEQNGPQARQLSHAYPSPQSYPSPQMQPAYTYPSTQTQTTEAYRQSPTTSTMPLPPMNLPPLRTIDGQTQPAPQQAPLENGQPPLPQSVQHPVYYPQHPPGIQHPGQGMTSAPHMMRYAPLPQGSDQRMMSGGRHKKEIKRRTKTGCLTCRKRRIKCDELHPVCRNCQKSKRECLGYDPIFKQQNPLSHQNQLSDSPPSSSSTPAPGSSTTPSGYVPAQAGYTPPMNSAYGSGSNGDRPAASAPPGRSPFEYGSAIDPALAGAEASAAPGPSSYGPSHGVDRKPSLHAHAPHQNMARKQARLLQIHELWSIDHFGPYELPPTPEPLSDTKMREILKLYINDFAPGMDGLLETTWYSTVGVDRLRANHTLCQQMAELIRCFTQLPGRNDYEADTRCRATETKVVWLLLSMCRPSTAPAGGVNGATSGVELDEVNKRLDIIEHLLTNHILPTNVITDIKYPADTSAEKVHEIDFWKSLGKFVTLRSDNPAARSELDGALTQCRNLLGGKENRDVIYSTMVGRHVGARVPEFPDHVQPGPGGEENDHNKLFIARTFITEQASYKGTNHPIQRLCDMVIRAWAIR